MTDLTTLLTALTNTLENQNVAITELVLFLNNQQTYLEQQIKDLEKRI